MKNFIKPLSLMGAGVLLGMSLFIGANIGKALMQIAGSRHNKKLQGQPK